MHRDVQRRVHRVAVDVHLSKVTLERLAELGVLRLDQNVPLIGIRWIEHGQVDVVDDAAERRHRDTPPVTHVTHPRDRIEGGRRAPPSPSE
jgi:hypothetical protein